MLTPPPTWSPGSLPSANRTGRRSVLRGRPDPVAANVLAPDGYARILYELGCVGIEVDLHVYPHVLASTHAAVEWVKGTTLTRFRSALSAEAYEAFLEDYERALLDEMGEAEPCFFPFNRILFVASKPST